MSFMLLGILNSQAAGGGGGAYELLESTTLTSSANTITFSSLGSYSDYKHLQIRYSARSTSANTNNGLSMQFNGDTGSNYTFHRIQALTSSVDAYGRPSASTSLSTGRITGGNAQASAFGSGLIDVLDFGSTQRYKTVRTLNGFANTAGAGYLISLSSGAWLNANAITSIEFKAESGSVNFAAGSSFILIGVK